MSIGFGNLDIFGPQIIVYLSEDALSGRIRRSVNWAPHVADIYIYIVMTRLKVQAF